jgi:hypothetical protein
MGAPALGAALIVALLCAGVAIYAVQQARQTAEGLTGSIPGRETVVIRADAPTVLRQVQALSQLQTSKYTLEKILDAERTRRYVPSFLAGEKLLFVAHGEVVAGLDLARVGEDDLQMTGDSLSIRLPEPRILLSKVDNERSHVYERETGLLSRPDKDLETQVRTEAERQIREAALESGILADARKNGEQSLRALLSLAGYKDIRFSYEGSP